MKPGVHAAYSQWRFRNRQFSQFAMSGIGVVFAVPLLAICGYQVQEPDPKRRTEDRAVSSGVQFEVQAGLPVRRCLRQEIMIPKAQVGDDRVSP